MNVTTAPWRVAIQLLFGLALTFLFYYMMEPFLVPLLLGGVMAILCYPIYQAARKKLPRALASFVTTLGIALGLLLPVFFVLYSVSFKLLGLISKVKLPNSTGPSLDDWVHHPWVGRFLSFISRFTPIDTEWVKEQAFQIFQNAVERLSKVIAAFFAGMPSLLLGYFVVLLALFFFLTDGARFLRLLLNLSPLSHERSIEVYDTFQKSCRGVVLGLFASALVQGMMVALLFLITGLPNIGLVFVLTIVMGMVPVVGSAPIWVGAAIYLFASDSFGFGIVMVVGGALTSVSDNIVRPWVMRGQSEMHPMLALVSVFGAVNLFGPPGIFLGPIVAAVFVSFLRILTLELRREKVVEPA